MKYIKGIIAVGLFFLFACTLSNAQMVKLDYYFNHEFKNSGEGSPVRFHYTWEDEDQSGFSKLASLFHERGLKTDSLGAAPNAENLKNTGIYIIVDPDTKKESVSPNTIQKEHINSICQWVKAGGVLLLLANDSGNVELNHFNLLVKNFGIQFNINSVNKVAGNNYKQGEVLINKNNPVFKTAKKLYLKDVSSLSLKGKAKAILTKNNDIIMATSKYGKGAVFVVGDPWVYNEYIDNSKLSIEFENLKGASDLIDWLISQIPVSK